MPRNRSEKVPALFAHLNAKQLGHMRNEALYQLGALSREVQQKSWKDLSNEERQEMVGGPSLNALRIFYKEQHRATKQK